MVLAVCRAVITLALSAAGVTALANSAAGRTAAVADKADDAVTGAGGATPRARARLARTILNVTDFALRFLMGDKASLR